MASLNRTTFDFKNCNKFRILCIMTIKEILDGFHERNAINADTITAIQNEAAVRLSLVNYFRTNHDRKFALALLNKFIAIRLSADNEELSNGTMPMEDLMLSCYILALHNHIEDALKIWEAKYADFDTYCGLDGQLIVFAGVKETIAFLEKQSTEEAKKALQYITNHGFDDLEKYFSPNQLPYFI